jgi:integrase
MASMKRYEESDGTPYWVVRWREGGKGRSGTSRQKRHDRKGLAEKHHKQVGDVEDRRAAGLPGGDGRQTLAEFFEDTFLELRSGQVRTGSVAAWKTRWSPVEGPTARCAPGIHHVGQAWGGWPMEDITREAVMRWHAKMRKAGCSDSKMNQAHGLLVLVLSFALELGYITVHPALDMRPDYTPDRIIDHWRPDTIEAIRDALNARAATGRATSRWRRDRDAVLVAVLGYLGLRPGEALALSWRNVLHHERFLWVTHTIPGIDPEVAVTISTGRTKTGDGRYVPWKIAPFVREILLAWAERMGPHTLDSPVFPHSEGDLEHPTYMMWRNWRKSAWKPALADAGVSYQKPYHLRHSALTMWIYTGMPMNMVAKRAGHTLEVCMNTYAGAWDTFDEDVDGRYDIEAAYRAARRASTRLRLVG